MKIIKDGNRVKLDKPRRFLCKQCGCLFEAVRSEYSSDSQYNETYYFCKCPFCNHTAYEDKTELFYDE